MASVKLVLNAVLNFVERAMKAGNPIDSIVKSAVSHFSDADILEAKKVIWDEAEYATRVTARDKSSDNVIDIMKVFKLCDEKNISLPRFVLYQPDDVPIIPGEISATLTRKVGELCRKFDSFVESEYQLRNPYHSRENNGKHKQTYAVVLKNPPQGLTDPESRKDYLNGLCGQTSNDIVELRPRKSAWSVLVKDKATADSIAQAITSTDNSVVARVKSPSFFGIIRHVPASISEEDLRSLVSKCVEASGIGKTRSFKLKFDSREDLQSAIKSPPVIGYERLPIHEYKFMPIQCYKCQCFGHAAKACPNPPKCSRCAGKHSSSKDNPCQNPLKCALCGSANHPCYSFKCPEAQKALKQ